MHRRLHSCTRCFSVLTRQCVAQLLMCWQVGPAKVAQKTAPQRSWVCCLLLENARRSAMQAPVDQAAAEGSTPHPPQTVQPAHPSGVHQPLLGLVLIGALLHWHPHCAAQQVNKCLQADGTVIFSDKPCERAARVPPRPAAMSASTSAQNKAMADRINREIQDEAKELARRRASVEASTPLPAAPSAVSSDTRPMDFASCNAVVRSLILTLAGTGRTRVIVASPMLTLTRICTDDGSVLVTCSAPDRRMVRTSSPGTAHLC
jgi:hypothetical protein